MALENRNLEAGTRLVARYKGQTYSTEVVQTEEGLRYRKPLSDVESWETQGFHLPSQPVESFGTGVALSPQVAAVEHQHRKIVELFSLPSHLLVYSNLETVQLGDLVSEVIGSMGQNPAQFAPGWFRIDGNVDLDAAAVDPYGQVGVRGDAAWRRRTWPCTPGGAAIPYPTRPSSQGARSPCFCGMAAPLSASRSAGARESGR